MSVSKNGPGQDQIRVSLDALRHDAERWRTASDDLRAAAHRASELRLDEAAFSFAGIELARTYATLRAKLAALLTAGANNCAEVAKELVASADTYNAEELAGVHRLRDIY